MKHKNDIFTTLKELEPPWLYTLYAWVIIVLLLILGMAFL